MRITLCLYSSTLFDRRYACSLLLCWSSTRGYFIKYVWRRKIFVTICDNYRIVAFTTPDPSIALDSAPIYNDAAVLARAIRIRVASNPLSLPVYARVRPCMREGFEFCPVGGAIEF